MPEIALNPPLDCLRADRTLSKDTFSGIAVRNLLFCPPLRTTLAGAGSKPDHHGVLMLPEVCIAHIFWPPLNFGLGGVI